MKILWYVQNPNIALKSKWNRLKNVLKNKKRIKILKKSVLFLKILIWS